MEASQEKTDQLILAEREPPLLAGWTGEMDELILGKRIGQIILFLILGTEISLDKLDLIPSRFSQGEYKLKGKGKKICRQNIFLKNQKRSAVHFYKYREKKHARKEPEVKRTFLKRNNWGKGYVQF